MKQHFTRFIAAIAAAVLCLTALAGCASGAGRGDNQTAAVLEGEKYSLDEAKLYIYDSQYLVEESSEFMISYMFASYEDFWNNDQDGKSYYQMNYAEGMNKLLQTKRLLKKAASDGITLDADDQAKVDAAFADFKETEANVVAAAGCSDELLKQYLTENALAVKTYLAMVEDVDTSFDEAEFRRKSVEALSVSAKTSKPTTDDSEEAEEYTEEEQTAAREAATAEVLEKLKAGETLDEIAADYNGDETVTVYSLGSLNLTPEDAVEEGAEYTSYRQFGWTLSTGDVDYVEVTSGSNPTNYVMHCLNDDDPELRKQAEDSELVTRKLDLFSERYAELTEKYNKYHVYEDVVNKVKQVVPMYESEILGAQAGEAAE